MNQLKELVPAPYFVCCLGAGTVNPHWPDDTLSIGCCLTYNIDCPTIFSAALLFPNIHTDVRTKPFLSANSPPKTQQHLNQVWSGRRGLDVFSSFLLTLVSSRGQLEIMVPAPISWKYTLSLSLSLLDSFGRQPPPKKKKKGGSLRQAYTWRRYAERKPIPRYQVLCLTSGFLV